MNNKILTIFLIIIACVRLIIAKAILFLFYGKLYKKNIWLISEKTTEARDNGFHFFNYMINNHSEDVFYYVIKKGAKDESKLVASRVIYFQSWRHCIYSLAAKYCIGGQSHFNRPYYKLPMTRNVYDVLKRKDQKVAFIRHGVAKDNIKGAFSHLYNHYNLITTGIRREYEYIKTTYNVPDDMIALTGLCRFDNLHDFTTKNQVLVMPTFRRELAPRDSRIDVANEDEMKHFVTSEYYKRYLSLINNRDLISSLRFNGSKLIFYLHYTFQPYRTLFLRELKDEAKDVVIIAGRNDFDVQTLLKESAFLITDYSSVFFDFAYMKKPLLYYQFDEEEYRSKHYKEGWFTYRRDGFGPVYIEEKDVISFTIKLMETSFIASSPWKERMDVIFDPYDKNNCERTYQEIIKIK